MAPVLVVVAVSSKWCGSSVAQFVNDSWVLDLTRRTTTANIGENWLIYTTIYEKFDCKICN